MFPAVAESDLDSGVAPLRSAVDGLLDLDLARQSDEDVLALVRAVEVQKNRLAALDHALIGEIEQRGLAGERACPSTAALLVQLLRIHPREAAGRVRAAGELGPRRSLSGTVLAPVYAHAAASVAAGKLSPRAAAVITSTIRALPAAVTEQHAVSVETFLVEQAAQHNPALLAQLARRIQDSLDPDGILASEADRHRRRELNLTQRPDGSAQLHGELDPIATEALLTVLDTLARPTPADDEGEPDRRTPGQRRHDALRDALLALIRTDTLPEVGGVAATIVLTMSAEQLRNGTGLVRTSHGATISTGLALTLVGDARILPVVQGANDRLEAYGHTHRIFTRRQRLAMTARDHGCSFPGCTIPPAWCQAHHITDYALTGHTRTDDGTLLCGYHHREHPRLGWKCTMHNGQPHWTPPIWIDPTQTPRQNHAHNPTAHLVTNTAAELAAAG